jgi:CopG family nickel-responsive transcriptional regulator
MSDVERFGVSMERDLLEHFDRVLARKGYRTRSEAIRDLVRKQLVEEAWEDPKGEVVGTVTLLYPHRDRRLAEILAEVQHRYHEAAVSSTHVHLDETNCLEVVILRGKSKRVRKISDALLATRGVRHGGTVVTSAVE